jgi:hypothetical protein
MPEGKPSRNVLFALISRFSQGPAIFDEPILNDTAHLLAECSNAGLCDRLSGYCACRPGFLTLFIFVVPVILLWCIGFSGPACQLRDCPRDSLG